MHGALISRSRANRAAQRTRWLAIGEQKPRQRSLDRLRELHGCSQLGRPLVDCGLAGCACRLVTLDVDATFLQIRQGQAQQVASRHSSHELLPHVGLSYDHAALLALLSSARHSITSPSSIQWSRGFQPCRRTGARSDCRRDETTSASARGRACPSCEGSPVARCSPSLTGRIAVCAAGASVAEPSTTQPSIGGTTSPENRRTVVPGAQRPQRPYDQAEPLSD